MPRLDFTKQFAPQVEDGTKRQTIRAIRARPFRIGDRLYMYTGPRMAPRTIGEYECRMVAPIIVWQSGKIWVAGELLADREKETIARNDGFLNARRMIEYLTRGDACFDGEIIMW